MKKCPALTGGRCSCKNKKACRRRREGHEHHPDQIDHAEPTKPWGPQCIRGSTVYISDLHVGCQLAICPPDGVVLGEGSGKYQPTGFQMKIWEMWRHFWDVDVPILTRGRPYSVVLNGECIDGVHHNSTHQWSHNLADQSKASLKILRPVFDLCGGRMAITRGTEAHSGQSGQWDEWISRELGVKPDKNGNYARYELWHMVGEALVHVTHHVGTTSSSAYESTAVYKELVEAYVDAGRWDDRPPDAVVRSHRHRHMEIAVATGRGKAIAVVTPGWQGKTPFAFRVAGARQSQPQFGGVVLNYHEDVGIYAQSKVWRLERSEPEVISEAPLPTEPTDS